MTEVLPIGTLVRVLPSAIKPRAPFCGQNRDATDAHGWLYFITDNEEVYERSSGPYEARSLATGRENIAWLPEEIEAAEGEGGD
jgi:hypothetical protein